MNDGHTNGNVLALIHKQLHEHCPEAPSPLLEIFIDRLLSDETKESLHENMALGLVSHLGKLWELIHTWDGQAPKVDIYPYKTLLDGYAYKRTIIHIVHKDSPFLVDSILALIERLGYTNHHFMECDLPTLRNPSGVLTDFPSQATTAPQQVETYLRFEIRGHLSPEALATLHEELSHTLDDIRFAVSDWQPMRHHIEQAIQELGYLEPSDDIPEVSEFLAWINDHHFTFLGYREFPINAAPHCTGERCLGIFRQDRWLPLIDLKKLADHHLVFSCSTDLIRFNQTKVPATVHRPTPMEVIAIKMFDKNGHLTGIRQFIGLSSATSYNRSPRDIPILRLKVRRLLKRSAYNPHGYMGKMLIQALEHFPRDELFQSTEEDLFNIIMNVLRLGPHRKVALFLRQDPYGEFISSLVYASKDHYSAELKEKFGALLSKACEGRIQSASSHVSDFAFARLHYILATHAPAQSLDTIGLRTALETTSRPWSEEFRTTLLERLGEEIAQPLYVKYKESFPASYQEVFGGAVALEDVQCIEACLEKGLQTRVYQPAHAPNTLRIKLYNQGGPVPLADILPILNNLDFNISKDMPYKVTPKEGGQIWIQDLEPLTTPPNLTPALLQDRFSEAFALIWMGKIENDGFNRLLLRTDLDIWQIQILRAYCKHLKQIGLHLSQTFIEDTLVDYASIAQNLVRLFEGRFNPQQKMTSSEENSLRQELEKAFDTVATLDQDQVVRKFYNLISSTLRTNAYQKNEQGSRKDYLSFKVNSKSIDELPFPRPYCEIFVYSPRMEAIHLRGGPVARGGIRWSDRREDFRTEVLSLLKAQMVKNAVIVPVGSKGGFVVKQLPEERAAQKAEIIACYQMMMCGLLDLTDNIIQGQGVPPQDVICYDEPDPYLVVAADKGTATFSDIANDLSAQYSFWMSDAFASGGSAGYDHKKMGITARGAWESTRRHFGELGIHPDTDPFTTIAIGDMSGDIFGNGMLLSPCIQLAAAFNHQYIFFDPTPDIRSSFAERQRLFNLPTSTWMDYNADLISVGGGVWNRSEKSIAITPPMRKILDLPEEITHLAPSDLIQFILKAPVDLMWFGGIGTFVKSSHESHADASDRANDLLRVDAQDMRCKVIVEGANLGMTQNARIEFALKGGLINTDAIDNSGGVDCSDHEVNIKILLSQVMSETVLTLTDRNALLASMTDDVAALVLRDNYLQNLLLSIKQQTAASQVEDYALLMKRLEDEGALDRLQNNLPTVGTLAERMAHQQGLTRPELAVLMAHTKTWVYESLSTSDFLDDPALDDTLLGYFPKKLQDQYPDQILAHPLRREIIGTMIANEVVNRFGITMICRLSQSSHQSVATIVRTLFSIMDLFELDSLWQKIEAFDHKLPSAVFLDLFVQIQESMEKVALGFLQQRRPSLNLQDLRATFARPLQELYLNLASALGGDPMNKWEEQMRTLTHLQIPVDMAKRIIFLKLMADNALDLIVTAQTTGQTVIDTARVYFYLNETIGLNWARNMLSQLTPINTWGLLSRSLLYGDLLKHQTRLVKAILQQSPRMGLTPLETWQNDHQADLERLFTLIKDIQSAPDFGLFHIDILSRSLGELV